MSKSVKVVKRDISQTKKGVNKVDKQISINRIEDLELLDKSSISLDTETTGLDFISDNVRLVQIQDINGRQFCFDLFVGDGSKSYNDEVRQETIDKIVRFLNSVCEVGGEILCL